MAAMCSIPHHTPRQRKGWTTAFKPSSSLFSCYSFQPYILIFPVLYPHCSRGMDSFIQPYILIVHGVWTHCLVRAGLLVAMSSEAVNAASSWR